MRYFLPGAIFFSYVFILILPQIEFSSLKLTIEQLVAIFGGIIVASPVVGYIIYATFDNIYGGYIQKQKKNRKALEHIEKKTHLTDYTQQKMFIFMLYYSTASDTAKIKIDPQILQTMKNYLTNYTSRMVSGVCTPIFSLIVGSFLLLYEPVAQNIGVSFSRNWVTLGIAFAAIIVVSIIVFLGSPRTLKEAYQLEEYLVKARKREIEILKKDLLEQDSNT